MQPRAQSRTWQLGAQLSLIVLAIGATLGPPARGAIVILPLVPGTAATTFRWAFEAGALPIAPGPYPGSIVVQGSVKALLAPAVSHVALLLAARSTGCGSKSL